MTGATLTLTVWSQFHPNLAGMSDFDLDVVEFRNHELCAAGAALAFTGLIAMASNDWAIMGVSAATIVVLLGAYEWKLRQRPKKAFLTD